MWSGESQPRLGLRACALVALALVGPACKPSRPQPVDLADAVDLAAPADAVDLAAPAPTTDCAASSVDWGGGCSAKLTAASDGSQATASSTATGFAGDATVTCSLGGWVVAAGSCVSMPIVEVYPGPGVDDHKSTRFSVEVYSGNSWHMAYTYSYSRTSVWSTFYPGQAPSVSFTTLGIDSAADVRVTLLSGSLASVTIEPASYHLEPVVTGNSATFRMKQGQTILVEPNGSTFDTLAVFANPLKPAVPAGATYFGPGVHHVGLDFHPPTAGIYLDGGAWVVGTLNLAQLVGPKILGPGVLSGEDWAWEVAGSLTPWTLSIPYDLVHASDTGGNVSVTGPITIDGPTLVASPMYHLFLQTPQSIDVGHTHLITPWTPNSDGFNLSGNVHVHDSFCFNNDNSTFPEYAAVGPVDIERTVIAGRAPFNVAYGYFTSSAAAATFSKIDVILPETATNVFEAVVDGASSSVLATNQVYRDITLHGDTPRAVWLGIQDTAWGAPGPAKGNLSNLTFQDIKIIGNQIAKSELLGLDAMDGISNIKFINFEVNGTYVDASNQASYFNLGTAVSGVSFTVTNQIKNHEVQNTLIDPWEIWLSPPAAATLGVDVNRVLSGPRSSRVDISNPGTLSWHVALAQPGVHLTSGKTYTIKFQAKADAPRSAKVTVQNNGTTWTEYFTQPVMLSREAADYGPYTFVATSTDPSCVWRLNLGADATGVWVDDVRFTEE